MIDPLILVRSLHIAATVLASGTVAFMVLVADVPALRRRLTLMIWLALAVAILSGLVWLILLAAEITGAPIVEVGLSDAWQVATGTRFGQVMSARLLLALLLGVLLCREAARMQLAAAAGLVALLALIGHAGATPGGAGAVLLASDMVHLLAAAAWLGALPALALVLAHAPRGSGGIAFANAAANRFSLIGMVCVGALLASGLISSWSLLAGPRDLVTSDYGRLLLLKIGLFGTMVALAAVNKYHLTPQLLAPAALRALWRNTLAELGLGLGVLLLAGALGTMEPSAHVHSHAATVPPDAAFAHLHDPVAAADVILVPGRAGRTKAIIRLTREDHSEFPAKELLFVLEPPAPGQVALKRAATRSPDGAWQVEEIEIPQPGVWTLRITITPAEGPPVLLDGPIVIEP